MARSGEVVENPMIGDRVTWRLKDTGIPSLIQRAPGFDAPDFLAAGPRDVLVPASLVEEAKQILENTTGLGSYVPY
jgi:hypothetical protein